MVDTLVLKRLEFNVRRTQQLITLEKPSFVVDIEFEELVALQQSKEASRLSVDFEFETLIVF